MLNGLRKTFVKWGHDVLIYDVKQFTGIPSLLHFQLHHTTCTSALHYGKWLNFSEFCMITRIRRFIDQSTSNHAVRSVILSRLAYCNGLLSSIPTTQLVRLQRLQNWAARLVFQVRRDTPSFYVIYTGSLLINVLSLNCFY